MLWAERIARTRRKTTNTIALGIALLAFSIRFYWATTVQSPLHALFTDMGSYYMRAVDFLDGVTHGDPRSYAFFPWGAHVLIGLELGLVGRTSHFGVAVVQSIVSTIPAVCVVYLTDRVLKSRLWMIIAGLVAAFWQPAIVHAGFFMSEMWFSAAIVVGTFYFLRHLEGRAGAFRAGCAFAIAIVVRPQVLLTFAIVAGLLVVFEAGRRLVSSLGSRASIRNWIRFLIPIALMLAVSAVRFHQLTQHWGLVSENGPINRVFGATHLGRVGATWHYKTGTYTAWYQPPAKTPVAAADSVHFDGYIGDAEILDKLREEHMKRETRTQYIDRMRRNIRMLIFRRIFPEDNYADDPQRDWLQNAFRLTVINILPFVAIGLTAMILRRRSRMEGMLMVAHGLTVVVVAALYFAEARMRMPYDPFIITAATVGVAWLFRSATLLRRMIVERLERA